MKLCGGLGLAALFKSLYRHIRLYVPKVWLPCSKGFRRMKLCAFAALFKRL